MSQPPPPVQTPPAGPWVLGSKPARALWLTVALALVLPLLPGLERLAWWPQDLWRFAPKLFRPADWTGGEGPQVVVTGSVDDDELLALAPRAARPRPAVAGRKAASSAAQPAPVPVAQGAAGQPGTTAPPGADALPGADARPGADAQPGAAAAAAPPPAAPPPAAPPPTATTPAATSGLDDPASPEVLIDSDAPLPPPPKLRTLKSGLPLLSIEDPQRAMRRFYARLARVEGGAPEVVRALHYGDSLITGDYVTGNLRRLLQRRFGDGGHGFILAGRPAPWYGHDHVKLSTSGGWETYRVTRPNIGDHRYGLGGVTFATRGSDWVEVATDGPTEADADAPGAPIIGANASKMQVFYLAQPGGGRFRLEAGGSHVEVDTRADAPASRLAEIQVADGPHTLRIKSLGYGTVRLFGAVMERDGPGVVYDSLGLDGARAKLLQRMNAEHWHDQLRLRRPDLLVLHYGTNESQAADLGARRYREDLSKVVGHLRAALPGVSCLLVGPMDRAERDAEGKLVSRPVVKRIVDVQRQVAYAQGCAFWNTWQAMGGEGSMAAWYRTRLAQGDLTHPTRRGADRVAAMLFAALMEGYAEHLAAEEAAPGAGTP